MCLSSYIFVLPLVSFTQKLNLSFPSPQGGQAWCYEGDRKGQDGPGPGWRINGRLVRGPKNYKSAAKLYLRYTCSSQCTEKKSYRVPETESDWVAVDRLCLTMV
jgi:hypothetical protein